jgi:D-amino-acid oxidase
MNTAQRITKRAIEWCPELVKPGQGVEGLDIIWHGVGLRPLREGGPRLERELIGDLVVVHNYGAGGFGCRLLSSITGVDRRRADTI